MLCRIFPLFYLIERLDYWCCDCVFEFCLRSHQRWLVRLWNNVNVFALPLLLVLDIISLNILFGAPPKVIACCWLRLRFSCRIIPINTSVATTGCRLSSVSQCQSFPSVTPRPFCVWPVMVLYLLRRLWSASHLGFCFVIVAFVWLLWEDGEDGRFRGPAWFPFWPVLWLHPQLL